MQSWVQLHVKGIQKTEERNLRKASGQIENIKVRKER